MVSESTNDRDFTVGTSSDNLATKENTMNVKTFEICFNEMIDRRMNNIGDAVEYRIQNAVLTAIDSIVAPKIELAIRLPSASFGRDATSVTANSERGEHVKITTPFENAPGNNKVIHTSNVNNETQNSIPDKVSEMSVPEARADRQTPTNHRCKIINWRVRPEILNENCSFSIIIPAENRFFIDIMLLIA